MTNKINTTIDTTFIKMVQQNNAEQKRKQKAEMDSANRKRKELHKNICKTIVAVIISAIVILALGIIGENDRQAELWNVSEITTESIMEV